MGWFFLTRSSLGELGMFSVLGFLIALELNNLTIKLSINKANPAKMLPNARRLIGFMRSGSFSLMEIRGGKRGFVIVTK